MNADKLRRLQAQVRIGGKGTPRRKKKVMHQSAATDDKKLQSSLKKLSVSTIPGIEEVNIIKDDLTVIHFNNPKAQASLSANTFAVTGHGETKKIVEMLPEILPQLGQDTVMQLRVFANSMSGNHKQSNSASTPLDNVAEEDDVPLLVNDFEEVAKMEETKIAKSKADGKKSEEVAKNNKNIISKEDSNAKKLDASKDAVEKLDKKSKKQQNKPQQQSANGTDNIKIDSAKIENKQPKQVSSNKNEKTQTALEKNLTAEDKQTLIKNEVKPVNEKEVKRDEMLKQRNEEKVEGKSTEKLQQVREPAEAKTAQKTEKAKLEKAQKPKKEEAKKIEGQAEQKSVKSLKQNDNLVEKKKEEVPKERKIQENKKKEETASHPKEVKGEQTKSPKPQFNTQKEEIVKVKEVKDSQKQKITAEKGFSKDSDMQTKAELKQEIATKVKNIENIPKEKEHEVSVQKTENQKLGEQKILAASTEEDQKKPVNEDNKTEKHILPKVNVLSKEGDSKPLSKEVDEQRKLLIEPPNVPVSQELSATAVNQNNESTPTAVAKQEKSQTAPLLGLTPSKEAIDQTPIADTITEKAAILSENINKKSQAEENKKQLHVPVQQPTQSQAITAKENTQEQKELKPSEISKPKEQKSTTVDQANKPQPSKQIDSKVNLATTNQSSGNKKKEELKAKSITQPGTPTKPAKPTTPKPSLQTKPLPPTRTPDKATTPVKPGTPTKATSPQPKTPTTPIKKTPPLTVTAPITPADINVATNAPAIDAKLSSDTQKKPATAPKPTQSKNLQQKLIHTENKISSAAKTSPVKTAPNAKSQQDEKKQVKAENSKQPQPPNSPSFPQQQPPKQSSPTKPLVPAKQSTSNKQQSPAKQAPPQKALTTTDQQQGPIAQESKISITLPSQQQAVNQSTGSSQTKVAAPQTIAAPQLTIQAPKDSVHPPLSQPKAPNAQLLSQQPKANSPQPSAAQASVSQPKALISQPGTPQQKGTSPQPHSPKVTTPLPVESTPKLSAQEQKHCTLPSSTEQLKGISTPPIAVQQQKESPANVIPPSTIQQHHPNIKVNVSTPQTFSQPPMEPKQLPIQAGAPQNVANNPQTTDQPQHSISSQKNP